MVRVGVRKRVRVRVRNRARVRVRVRVGGLDVLLSLDDCGEEGRLDALFSFYYKSGIFLSSINPVYFLLTSSGESMWPSMGNCRTSHAE
jgi:hypothetical protein